MLVHENKLIIIILPPHHLSPNLAQQQQLRSSDLAPLRRFLPAWWICAYGPAAGECGVPAGNWTTPGRGCRGPPLPLFGLPAVMCAELRQGGTACRPRARP